MRWSSFISIAQNSELRANAPSSSVLMEKNFLPWFLSMLVRNLMMSRGARLLVVGKIQGYDVPASTTESAAVLLRMEVTE